MKFFGAARCATGNNRLDAADDYPDRDVDAGFFEDSGMAAIVLIYWTTREVFFLTTN